MHKNCSDEEFTVIVRASTNIRQALIKLGLAARGGNYEVFTNRCLKLGLVPPKEEVKLYSNQQVIRKLINNFDIISACMDLYSRAAVLKKLELSPAANSNVQWINNKIQELNIDTSHWTGQAHLRGKTHNWAEAIPLEEILVENSTYTCFDRLKKKLVQLGIFEYKCSICFIKNWLDGPISLQLDHISGNRRDNRLENLRLLCPNCHSRTPTFCRKKSSLNKPIPDPKIKPVGTTLCVCGKKKHKTSDVCWGCTLSSRKKPEYRNNRLQNATYKITWPSLEELRQLVNDNGFLAAGKILGVSDNAIRKHLSKHS